MNQDLTLSKPFRPNSHIWVIDETKNQWISLKSSKNTDYSTLVFDLSGIDQALKVAEKDNTISIARLYPQLSNNSVIGLAASIKEAKKIKKNDCILNMGSKSHIDIGFVTEKMVNHKSSRIQIGIHWLDAITDEVFHLSLKPNQPIQSMDLGKFFGQDSGMMKLEKKLTDLGHTAFSYSETAHTIDYTNDFELLQAKIKDLSPKEDKGGKIEIFFGTNRAKLADGKFPDPYANTLNDELIHGFCEVSIPKGHVQGEIERPFKFWRFEFPEWLTDHVVLTKTTEKTESDFLRVLDSQISLDPEKSALIFIHGFNTSFEEAARRTAQISWDIPFNGAAGFFSWPSSGKTFSYMADGDKAEASAPAFSKFLLKILENTEIEQMHLIAHSMGSRVLTFAIKDLIHDHAFHKKAHIIQQIVLGAPDIDQDTFKKSLLPAFETVGKNRTLYTSDKDKALGHSEEFRGGRPRLGQAGASLFVEKGIDTIEASNVPAAGNRHSYIFDTKELLTDLFLLLSQGFSPAQRRLKAIAKGPLKYWLFPK